MGHKRRRSSIGYGRWQRRQGELVESIWAISGMSTITMEILRNPLTTTTDTIPLDNLQPTTTQTTYPTPFLTSSVQHTTLAQAATPRRTSLSLSLVPHPNIQHPRRYPSFAARPLYKRCGTKTMGKHEPTELRGILIGATTALACVCSRIGLVARHAELFALSLVVLAFEQTC